MKSMTGFGTAEYSDEKLQISIEIKTINHRYKEFNFKISRKFTALEDFLRKIISERISRGRIEVSLKIKTFSSGATSVKYDTILAHAYEKALRSMKEEFASVPDDFSLMHLATMPEVLTVEEEKIDITEIIQAVYPVVCEALDKLEKSREEEGNLLKQDFIKRCGLIRGYTKQIEEISDGIPKACYEELMKNIHSYTQGVIDENRLMTEVAIYADHRNITEELVRISSHLVNFEKIIENKEPIGRKLDFLFQEINREANTMASKTNSFEISTLVVEIKSELEKMREQIQNIE